MFFGQYLFTALIRTDFTTPASRMLFRRIMNPRCFLPPRKHTWFNYNAFNCYTRIKWRSMSSHGRSHEFWSGPFDWMGRGVAREICLKQWIFMSLRRHLRTVARDSRASLTSMRENQASEELQIRKSYRWKFVWPTQHLHLRCSTETASYWTNDSAQSTTPVLSSRTIVWEMQTLPWDDGPHWRASVMTSSLLSRRTSTRVFCTYVADWLGALGTSN